MFAVILAAVALQALTPLPPIPPGFSYGEVYSCKILATDARAALQGDASRPPEAEAAARIAVLTRLETRVDEDLPRAVVREGFDRMPGWRDDYMDSAESDLRALLALYPAEQRAEMLEGCVARFEVADR